MSKEIIQRFSNLLLGYKAKSNPTKKLDLYGKWPSAANCAGEALDIFCIGHIKV